MITVTEENVDAVNAYLQSKIPKEEHSFTCPDGSKTIKKDCRCEVYWHQGKDKDGKNYWFYNPSCFCGLGD